MVIKHPTSIFYQIVIIIQKRIQDGTYALGERLPSESQFAKEFGVSRGTIQKAFDKLESTGLILRHHGSGTFVTQTLAVLNHHSITSTNPGSIFDFRYLIETSGRTSSVSVLSLEEVHASEEDQKSFQISSNDLVVCITRCYFADQKPVLLTYDRIPRSIFKVSLAEVNFSRHIVEILRDYCKEQISYSNARIKATLAEAPLAEILNVPVGSPLLLLQDLIFSRVKDLMIVRSEVYLNSEELSIYQLRPWY